MIRRRTIGAMTAIIWLLGSSLAFGIDREAINSVEFGAKKNPKLSFDPVMVKAQVLLDRARFSPSEIDGRAGESSKKAIAAFETAQGLRSDGILDAEIWGKLTATSSEPVLTEYTLTNDDVKGPFIKKLPSKMEEMPALDYLGYTTAREAVAEKFHMSESLLEALNPGKTFDKAGETIVVANVSSKAPTEKVTKIEIDKSRKLLRGFAKDGRLLAVYPASIGSKEKPAPSGTYKITSVAQNPTYTYNPGYRFKGVKSTKPFTIQPGPNNPVGSVWINLSLKGYGIHGTARPSEIGKTESHGCVRLTNWDAKNLAAMVEKGASVTFLESSPTYESAASPVNTTSYSRRKR